MIPNRSSCEDINFVSPLSTQSIDLQAPRRRVVRFFEKYLFLISWLVLFVPLSITLILMIADNDYNAKCFGEISIIFWLIATLIYSVAQSQLGQQSFNETPWYLKLFHRSLYLFHIGVGIAITAWVHYSVYQCDPMFAQWIWILYVVPSILASENANTNIFLLTVFISVFVMAGIETIQGVDFLNSQSDRFFPIFIKVCFIFIIGAARHYAMRRYNLWLERSYVLQDCLSRITGGNRLGTGELRSLEGWMAAEIAKRLKFQKVFILILNHSSSEFELAGGYCEGMSNKELIDVRFSRDTGISGHVLKTNFPHLARRVERCSHYITFNKFERTKSELATPIIIRSKVIGVLDIQSDRADDFSYEDIHVVSALANVIALKLEQEERYKSIINRENSDFVSAMTKTLSNLHYKNSFLEIFSDFSEKLINQMEIDLVLMYRLAPGTAFPLLPPLVRGDLINKEYLLRSHISRESILFELLGDWKPRYCRNSQTDPLFGYSERDPRLDDAHRMDRFVFREKINSSVFIPIGTTKERIAALFLNYRHPHSFDDNYRIKIHALSSLYVVQMLVVQQKQLRESPLFLDAPDYHMKFGVQFLRLSSQLKLAVEDPLKSKRIIESVSEDLKTITREVFLEESFDSNPFSNPYELERQLQSVAKILEQSIDENVRFEIIVDPHIFYSGRAVSQAIYAIVSEAMLNAVLHGNASKVDVNVNKFPNSILVSITDNGSGFDVEKAREVYEKYLNESWKGVRGIYSRLDAVKEIFGATKAEIHSERGHGTTVAVEIPLISEA